MTKTISIADIDRTLSPNNLVGQLRTQFRVDTCPETIESLKDLIERGIKFATPIQLAKWKNNFYVIDGHHRIEAYRQLGINEIPTDQIDFIDVSNDDSMNDQMPADKIRLKAMQANISHGRANSPADLRNMIDNLMNQLDCADFMKNRFEPDVEKIADALGAPLPRMRSAYSKYIKPGEDKTLSQYCKAKRDLAVMNCHELEMSTREIAKKFGLGQSTVNDIINRHSESVVYVNNNENEIQNVNHLIINGLIVEGIPLDDSVEILDGEELDGDLSFDLFASGFAHEQPKNKVHAKKKCQSSVKDYPEYTEIDPAKLQEIHKSLSIKLDGVTSILRTERRNLDKAFQLSQVIVDTIQRLQIITKIAKDKGVILVD